MECVMFCVADFEKHAEKTLSQTNLGFYKTGSYDDNTIQWNREAFHRWRLRPRFLRDVSHISMETTLLGEHVDFPVGASPAAFHCLAHPDGELATVKACSDLGTVMVASIFATKSIEDIAKASGNGIHWQQLYLNTDRSLTEGFIRRAELAGVKALVITIDSPILPMKLGLERNGWELPRYMGQPNYPAGNDRETNLALIFKSFNPAATWEDIRWVCNFTHLPVVVKGLLSPEDAELAIQSGVAGILVSNHGGRQLNTDMATLDALRDVVEVVNGRVEVYMDGGVRLGTDVFKALALGARAVFVGRPILWGLSYQGYKGVSEVLKILRDELKLAMILSGCRSLSEIVPDRIVRHDVSCRL